MSRVTKPTSEHVAEEQLFEIVRWLDGLRVRSEQAWDASDYDAIAFLHRNLEAVMRRWQARQQYQEAER